MTNEVQLPAAAVNATGDDIGKPTENLLLKLGILSTPEDRTEAGKFSAVFGGPPQSVAVIEAGATALSKWWAMGLGAAILAVWPGIELFWKTEDDANLRVLIVGLAIAIASTVLAIGYIVGSDVRGRASASTATIEARARIAETIARLAESVSSPPAPPAAASVIALPAALAAVNVNKQGDDERGWRAIAMSSADDHLKFLLVKGPEQEWVEQSKVQFQSYLAPKK